jgi:hypothetical protein
VLITEARIVAAEARLPELGRCAVAPFEKVEREKRFKGQFRNASCTFENPGGKVEQFEWFPGPGPKPKFKVAAGTTTLETATGTKLTCTKEAGTGETTGSKTSTMTLRLTGCKLPASKQTCQSAGAAAGEIVSGPLDGQIGFIEDQYNEGVSTNVIGVALSGGRRC